MIFEKELKKLGLKDKEASVYLACLEIGPSPAQPISRKSKVVRATTYVVLESLMNRGLVTKYKKGKKTLFSAEPPRQLTRLLEKQQEEIQERQHHLEKMLPELQIIMQGSGDRPSVRYFEGREGLNTMRQEIVRHAKSNSIIYNFTPVDYLDAIFPDEGANARQRAAKGIQSKTLFSTRSESTKNSLLEGSRYYKRRFIPIELFPCSSGMTIFEDRIAIGSFVGNLMGVVVESKPMAEMMKHLFELAWMGAEMKPSTESTLSRNTKVKEKVGQY